MLQMLFHHTSYNVSYLDGSMSYDERAKAVDEFNSDSGQFVFLISTKAGGVGLNITSANKVVVVDPNWNPSYDLQAQDRAYRIGQHRDVEVFRLISAGTIEEIVYARQIYKQQQANIGYNASSERRYFQGVQEKKEKGGDLWSGEPLCLPRRQCRSPGIVNKTNVAESKAGVLVAGVSLVVNQDDDDDDYDNDPLRSDEKENAAMSQLVAEITGESKGSLLETSAPKKTDAIQAILASAGVEYTHENSEVIGTSRMESKLSRQALERGNDVDTIGEFVFVQSQGQGDPEMDLDLNQERDGRGLEADSDEESIRNVIWKYRPPEDVRQRQFCTMAETFGFSDPTEFALVVEGWTQAQRRNCLDKFYKIRRGKVLVGKSEKVNARSEESDASL